MVDLFLAKEKALSSTDTHFYWKQLTHWVLLHSVRLIYTVYTVIPLRPRLFIPSIRSLIFLWLCSPTFTLFSIRRERSLYGYGHNKDPFAFGYSGPPRSIAGI